MDMGGPGSMNVIVVGCGRVGSQLATLLSVDGHNVTVIDKEADSFRRLGTTFNGVTIRGLGFDEDVLEEAGIRECDAFAAVTDLDNTNLMAAEVARKIFDVPHVVARLYNPQRERTYQQLDLDYVCGTTLVAESLLDKIQSGHGHHIDTFGDVEIVVFKLRRRRCRQARSRTSIVAGQVMVGHHRPRKAHLHPDAGHRAQAGDVMRVAMKDDAMHTAHVDSWRSEPCTSWSTAAAKSARISRARCSTPDTTWPSSRSARTSSRSSSTSCRARR